MRGAVRWLRNMWPIRGEAVAHAYQRLFDGRDAEIVLADLAKLCHATHSSVVSADPHATTFNEGKRSVFLHIAEMRDIRPQDFERIQDIEP